MNTRLFLVCAATLAGLGCDRSPRVTIETPPPTPTPIPRAELVEISGLRAEIDAYATAPSAVQAARVEKAFAETDVAIAELKDRVSRTEGDLREDAARRLAELRAFRDGESVRFRGLQSAARSRDPNFKGGAEKVGEKIDDAARKVGEEIKDAADAIRDRVR